MLNSIRKNPTLLLLEVILLLGLFFRLYQSYNWLLFGHDQDLAAWIVKDIIINHHLRLIGQETSIGGLFIGGLYYYSMVPFFWLLNMHPIASLISPTIISLLTIVSLYFVNSRLFNKNVGLLTAFFYAISINQTLLDRWSVPTQPTMLWATWFFYSIISLTRANLKVIPILIVLIALIWHVHIAFIPLLILIPFALILNKTNLKTALKKVSIKWLIISFIMASILLLPLFIFEFRYNFQQLHGLLRATVDDRAHQTLLERTYIVIQNFGMTFIFPFYPKLIPINHQFAFINLIWPLFVLSIYSFIFGFLIIKKVFEKKEVIIILSWLLIVFLGQTLTKRSISEYYFYNLLPLSILFISLAINKLLKQKRFFKIIIAILIFFIAFNTFYFVSLPTPNREYLNIEKTILYIKADSQKNNYSCIALNFFGEPGTGVGFYYPSWYHKLPLIRPNPNVPTYNIAIPPKFAPGAKIINGDFAIIPPTPNQKFDFSSCNNPDFKLIPPLSFTS